MFLLESGSKRSEATDVRITRVLYELNFTSTEHMHVHVHSNKFSEDWNPWTPQRFAVSTSMCASW